MTSTSLISSHVSQGCYKKHRDSWIGSSKVKIRVLRFWSRKNNRFRSRVMDITRFSVGKCEPELADEWAEERCLNWTISGYRKWTQTTSLVMVSLGGVFITCVVCCDSQNITTILIRKPNTHQLSTRNPSKYKSWLLHQEDTSFLPSTLQYFPIESKSYLFKQNLSLLSHHQNETYTSKP